MRHRCLFSPWNVLFLAVAVLWLSALAEADEPSVARLIDQLAEVNAVGVGFHPTAWASGFIGVDDEPQFQGGILGSEKPVIWPPLRTLVQKGLAALPELIDHLSDRRETKVTISGFMGMWHSNEYDPRRYPPLRYLPGPKPDPVYDASLERLLKERKYTVRVGDLCYVAIGQIVNRNLCALRYQPSLCLVINSPIATPSIAESARRDWGGLTAHQHKQSLIRDASAPCYDADPGALVRLWFYYPDDGEKLALKLLERPLYNDDTVWRFVATQLVEEKDPARCRALIDDFGREHGVRYTETIPFLLRWIYWKTDVFDSKEFIEKRTVAFQILSRLYPKDDPNNPSLPRAVEPRQIADLIFATNSFRSRLFDESVHRLYHSMNPQEFATEDAKFDFDRLSTACIRRLATKRYPDMIVPYFKLRLQEFQESAQAYLKNDLIPMLTGCLPLQVLGIRTDDRDAELEGQ